MPPISSPPPQPAEYDIDGPFPDLSVGPRPSRRQTYAAVLATTGQPPTTATTATSSTRMPADEDSQEGWTAEDVDVPPGLSELSGAVLPIRIGGTTAASSTLASDFYAVTTPPSASTAPTTPNRRPRTANPESPEQSLTLDRLLGSPSSLRRRPASVGGESSVPDHLRRTSAWRLSGPGRVVSDPLGMSLPNDRIDSGRDIDREMSFPWTNGVESAHRAGYYGQQEPVNTARDSSTPAATASRLRANMAASIEARLEARVRERTATILDLAQRRSGNSSIAIPGGRGMISTGPQQVVPTNSHFSWASYGAGTTTRPNATASTSSTPAPPEPAAGSWRLVHPPADEIPSRTDRDRTSTVFRRRRTDTDSAVRTLVERMNESGRNESATRQAYAFDPADIAPPGGADDHIWDVLGMPDSDDDDDISRWGTYRAADVLRAGRAAVPTTSNNSLAHLLDLDGWGSSPETGAALSRGRFNRRRRSSVRSRENEDEQPMVSHSDDAMMVEVPTPTRRFPPTNTGASQPPVMVGDERARRRRESDHGSGHESPWPSKRVRRDPLEPDTTRPSYASMSSLPASTPLPTDFTPSTRDSWLELTTREIRGVARPVVTFVLSHAASMIIEDTESDACALRSNIPIPADIGVHYYEVEVLERAEGYLTVGWMQAHVSLNRLVGWDPGSWGWHGDDGQTFESRGEGNDFGEAWASGDIIGCGVDYTTGRAFFTLNGKLVGHVFSKMPQGLHPAVGLRSPGESLAINFTGPFKYDIDKHVSTIRDRVRSVLQPPKETFSSLSKSIPVPRLAGLPGRAVPRAKTTTTLPSDSPLQTGADRATAAFVLDHLITSGHGRVASSLLRDMQKRGWISPREINEESQAVKVADVTRALKSGNVKWNDLRSLDAGDGGAWAHMERRLSVYAFAESALSGSEDAVSTGRELRRRAKDEKWNSADIKLLDVAASSLVGVEDAALVAARAVDAEELERVLREAQGLKLRSCLHMAVAQTGLVHEVLIGRNDGEAAFLGLEAVL